MTMDHDLDIQFLENHLRSHPDSLLFARLAEAYLQSQQLERATELCEEGTKRHPYYATGHLVLGKCYLASKQYDQAEKEFKRVLLFDPKYLAAHKLYGDLMQEIGWENTCENSYKKILQIDPLDETVKTKLSELTQKAQASEAPPAQPESPEAPTKEASADSRSDLESIGPLPLSSDEEDMLYEGEQPPAEDETPELETPQPTSESADTDKFSSILDDIFKDEVVQDEESTPSESMDIYSSEEDLVSEIQKEPEKYFESMRRDDQEAPQSDEPENSSPHREEMQKPAFEDREVPEEKSEPEPPSKPAPEEPKPSAATKNSKSRDKIVTPTLGEIYAAQGQYSKAINVFELLLSKNPDNQDYAKKIEQLKEKLAETGNASQN